MIYQKTRYKVFCREVNTTGKGLTSLPNIEINQLNPNFKVPQRSNAPNRKAIKTRSHAFCLIAQGAKNTSPMP